MSAGYEFERLLELMATLRAPDGCPWDRKQTMDSLRPYILEEAYELVDAIRNGGADAIREELGDMLLEVVFVTQIAIEDGWFEMTDVVRSIHEKLVRRHPHVFDSGTAADAEEALERWEDIKAQEKPKRTSILDGVPTSLPALSRAAKLSKKAANAGFDWTSRKQVHRKIVEEVEELGEAIDADDQAALHEEIGDLLFAAINLARHAGTDAEVALTDANEKFSKRFRYIEEQLASRGTSVEETSLEELERLWQEAKG